jgi:hypothetical protein
MRTSGLAVLVVWILVAVSIAALAVLDVDAGIRRHWSNLVQLGAAYACALLCFRTAGLFPPGDALRGVWMLFALGVLAWALGQSYFYAYTVLAAGAEAPFPSIADAGFLLIGPLVVFALLRFKQAAGLVAPPLGIACAAILGVLGGVVTAHYNAEGLASPDLLLRGVSIAYVVFDPAMLAVTVLVAFGFGRGRIARSWWSVVVGIAVFLAANQVYSYLVFSEAYVSGVATDALWPIAFGLIAHGALSTRSAYAGVDLATES